MASSGPYFPASPGDCDQPSNVASGTVKFTEAASGGNPAPGPGRDALSLAWPGVPSLARRDVPSLAPGQNALSLAPVPGALSLAWLDAPPLAWLDAPPL